MVGENFPAVTPLGLWAAARSGRLDMTGVCERAAAFVASFARPDGGIHKPATGGRGSGGLSTYTDNTFWENDSTLVTAYAVLTLEYAAGK